MMPNSRMMIHDALGLCIGQAADMREYAAFLDDSSDNIAEIYASRAGGTAEEWRTTMTANGLLGQWYTAQEAVDAGLADSVGGSPDEPEDRAPAAPGNKTDEPETPAAEASTDAIAQRQRHQAHRHALNEKRLTRA
jgi:ClpP class serine protease